MIDELKSWINLKDTKKIKTVPDLKYEGGNRLEKFIYRGVYVGIEKLQYGEIQLEEKAATRSKNVEITTPI